MAAEYVDGLPSDIVDFVKVDRMRHGDKVMFQSWVLPLRVHCFAAAGAPCHATREVVDPASRRGLCSCGGYCGWSFSHPSVLTQTVDVARCPACAQIPASRTQTALH